ncbi:blast:RE1-silencing transcription factor [Drosophila guanche]|uniref:Blast:RE1-silencing transcription factor n=1 Tax=Drosophila guanche TaxID=7266 RepID=A0A3B0KAK7_DROGU|nr:blast:RE1-silencing transcription factor [Drosophila guanche]
MDLPSMVQRSGDTLIVRSVVSGNQLYAEQGGHNPSGNQNSATSGSSSSLLERHVERYRLQHLLQQQQQAAAAAAAVVSSVQQQQQQQQQHQQQQQQAVISMDAKEEGLPQCKIKRNYSCNHCAYFTQNPRYHLTHLRDVHGEKIVINKCKLCLYASRHFQKLVRHMKMVHGCTDGIPSGHGQARGKRGMSREARKRRLEESVGVMGGSHVGGQGLTVSVPDVPTLEQVKRELQLQEEKLQRDIEAFNQRQREEQQQMEQQLELANSYERQMQMQLLREFERQSPPEPPTPSPSGSATPPSHCEEPQNRLLKCSACEFTTLYRTQLRAHELAEHGKTKFFRCDKCSYVTHIKARFSKHVKYHSMPMIKCVTCDFRTPYKWNLDRHMKNHGGAGAFKCAACDFTADIKQSLTVHEMNHHVPPVGNAGSIWPRRQNKVGASELCDDFLSDSAELEDQYNNNNVDDDLLDAGMEDPDEVLSGEELHHYGKRSKYDDEEEPTDLSQKGGCSSDTSSVGTATPNRSQRPVPNLIPISKGPKDVLNLSKDTNASRSTLTEIASMFFNEKQISEMLDKSDVPQLSPATTVTSQASSRSQPTKKTSSSFLDKLKTGAQHENLICQCGHVAKCLSESIIHGKSCHASAVIIADEDDAALHEDDADDRLEIDEDDEDHHSHSALNLSVTGSTRCQHCRHRCKSSNDLLHHLTQCVEAIRCANEMYDSNSGESSEQRRSDSHHSLQQQAAVQQQRVCIWNKAAKEIAAAAAAAVHQENSNNNKSPANSQGTNNEENSYYGVETAPGYGEMTPEEEAANSSLKKVYKCPHCSFWASTASRFHVHIVGHLNKKPFECSLCSYRSNWRWDITKHIRLKTIRDPSHKTAKVLMNDETGRRNYTKYNKYITLMKVTEEDGDPKLMKSGEMTPNQVASLAFLKDYAKVGSGSGQDITLEPVLSSKPNALDDAHLADNLIRIPLLATIMNAAMSQQQHQQHQQHKEQQHITPSVTISPVKRSNQAPPSKPSDDLITEVHQEGNEKRTVYRCRKCNFGHHNRDAVLAHVKIHYQDASYPKSAGAGSSSGTSPLQVSVSTNPQYYMNKVFAAMCLGQSSPTSNATNPGTGGSSGSQQHSLISAGLLQRAIQEAQHSPTPNASALSGLALALAGGKSAANTTKASAASILEHGEQKASQNEASADSLTSPTTTTTNNNTTTKEQIAGMASSGGRSLQDLLTSPRTRNGGHAGHHGAGTATGGLQTSNHPNANSNNSSSVVVMGTGTGTGHRLDANSSSCNNIYVASSTTPTATATGTATANNHKNASPTMPRHCRLKHSGDIRIETLERGGSAPAIYRPLGAGASNESQSHINSTTNSHASTSSLNILNSKLGNGNGNGSSNNSSCAQQLLMSSKQLEQLLHSPLSAGAAAVVNAANTQQDLQAVAAYWAAACKAAVANGEELLQLQQNDQIEITRLPSAANQEHQSNQSNTKSKQQKCPVCPYISESKSQMNYHVSLHKPTQYECRLCTFVCAKKQHLSSHMRSVHQQQLAVGGTGAAGTGGASSLGLDFSVALQLAAAAKQVQQLPASTPLSIDLSQLQLDAASDAEMNPQQLPPEYQYKLISYCPRCPARFAQKHNDERQGKQELEQHLTAHAAANDTETEDLYVCTYCGYRTGEETLLQLHRAVHMSHYQEKCQQLYKNCKEDVEFPAPKLMQITGPETIWVVDSELSVQLLQQQAAGGVSSSTSAAGSFSGQNSLLKKQLESGSGLERVIERESTPQPKPQEAEAEAEEDEERRSSSTPSTSASVATSDLAADGSSDAGSMDMPQSASAPERCLHCPFETQKHEELQQHLPHHGVVQAAPEGAHLCAHCDYHSATEAEIEEHTVVHFNASEKLKSVEFYTCYDNLEISMEQESEEPAKQHTENNNNQDNVINANMQEQQQEQSDTEHRDGDLDEQPPAKKHSTKIILYKSDGALSVKPSPEEPSGAESQSRSENISDRLRRRILRGSAPTAPEEGQEQRPTTPEKMILVNPKTGKVISRK